MRKLVIVSMTVLLLALSNTTASAQVGEFVAADCPMEIPAGLQEGLDVFCGYVEVPEVHANPDGPTIRLAVGVYRSTSANPAPDPLFIAQGGPGGSTLDMLQLLVLPSGDPVRQTRDMVLVEQRGTQYSEPALMCTEMRDLTYATLDQDLSLNEANALVHEALTACRERLAAEGINLAAYNSVENAADMNLVRLALGYDQINFYGVSYGTMLAQHYMRDFPQTLRSVTLDAVVPLSLNFVPEIPANAQRAFDLLFATCAADAFCSRSFPDLESTFYETVAALNAEPAVFDLQDALNDGSVYPFLMNGDTFMVSVFQLFYVSEAIPLLPAIIGQASSGRFDILTFILPFIIFDFSLAEGMYNSVLCAEDADFTAADARLAGVRPEVAAVFEIQSTLDTCALWNIPPLGSYVDDPVVSDIPTLVMSGEFDPITPPSNADVVVTTLSSAFAYTFPATGHGSFFTSCGGRVLASFLEDPTRAPDTSCIATLGLRFISP